MVSEYDVQTSEVPVDDQPRILHESYRAAMVAGGYAPHLFSKGERYDWQCLEHVADSYGRLHTCGFTPQQHFEDATEWDALPDARKLVWVAAAARLADHNARLVGVPE